MADLIAEIQAADGSLAIPDPVPELRAGYRRAISAAISGGLVPEGYGLFAVEGVAAGRGVGASVPG